MKFRFFLTTAEDAEGEEFLIINNSELCVLCVSALKIVADPSQPKNLGPIHPLADCGGSAVKTIFSSLVAAVPPDRPAPCRRVRLNSDSDSSNFVLRKLSGFKESRIRGFLSPRRKDAEFGNYFLLSLRLCALAGNTPSSFLRPLRSLRLTLFCWLRLRRAVLL